MSDSQYIVEATEQNINEILQQSMQFPILLDFWADWCEPCQTLAPVLTKLAEDYQGGFILAKVNADEQQMIAQQLGVRSLPTMKLIFKGQLVGELVGAQPEAEIRKLLDQVAQAPEGGPESGDSLMDQVERAKAMGAYDEAVQALMAALQENPDNNGYKAEIVNLLLDQNKVEDAKGVLAQIPADAKEKAAPTARLAFMEKAENLPSPEEVAAALEANPKDVAAVYASAVYSVINGDIDGALAGFLGVMVTDRSYEEDAGRLALLDLFNVLGADDPRCKSYRRKMFAYMH